ncbi:hypothetical protein PM082_006732 [Marasmius tenuissimus]|nr:hypothetical protein PM082_006732 [Marasmius tenuissimus]
MFFRTVTIVSTIAVLFAAQAMGAILIATDPVSACNPPNNGDHHAGSSCKYYSGPSSNSPVITGTCAIVDGKLICVR